MRNYIYVTSGQKAIFVFCWGAHAVQLLGSQYPNPGMNSGHSNECAQF